MTTMVILWIAASFLMGAFFGLVVGTFMIHVSRKSAIPTFKDESEI